MASNVQFQSSAPATPSSGTLVQTVQQADTSQRQVISVGDFWGSSAGSISVTLSSNPTVIQSSNTNVTVTGIPTVLLSTTATNFVTLSSNATISGTVTLSSNPTVIPSSAFTVALSTAVTNTVTASPSSVYTVTLSSNPTVIPSSAFNVTLTSNTVALSSNVTVQGDVANAATDSGNPVKIGGIYNSTNPTSVSSGQRVQAWFDKSGKQIVIAALRALKGVQLTAISCSVTETNITPSSSGGNFLDIYGLVLCNLSSANVQQVTIKDSSGGTSRVIFEVPAGDTRGFMLPVDAAIPQSGSSQAWTATLSNSSGAFQVTTLYVTNV